jgi:hypothetical protein
LPYGRFKLYPTAHTSSGALPSTDVTSLFRVPGLGVGVAVHDVPLKCIARVIRTLVVEVSPTAHASLAENAFTAVNEVFAPAGLGTVSRLQDDPFQRSATADSPVLSAPVALPTAIAELGDVESTPDSPAEVFAPPLSRSGLATMLHLVPL